MYTYIHIYIPAYLPGPMCWLAVVRASQRCQGTPPIFDFAYETCHLNQGKKYVYDISDKGPLRGWRGVVNLSH